MIYTGLQNLILGYAALVAGLAIFLLYFEVKYGFKSVVARSQAFQVLNRLHGHTVIPTIQVLNFIALAAWLALALPLVDTFSGAHLISTLDYEKFTTWFGELSGREFDLYFITVFIGILVPKGFFILKRMADILKDDRLAMNKIGQWGGSREFKKA